MQVSYNEMDVLPAAYSVFDSEWLANDWYLSLRIPYRELFGNIVGFFIELFGFIPTLLFGRLVTYGLFAYAFFRLLESVRINFFVGCVVLMTYLSLFSEGFFYGEWIVGGLETKALSYAFVLLSIAAFLRNQLKGSLLFAGLALSFHILVGGYFIMCLSVILLIKLKSLPETAKKLIKNSPYFLLGGIWGLYGVYSHLSNNIDSDLAKYGWEIYTQVRVPYHVMPKFSFLSLSIPLAFAVFSFAVLRFSKRENLRILSAFALTTYAIPLTGYLVYFTGEIGLLRFYFFRFNDAIQPLLSLVILGSIISNKFEFTKNKLALHFTKVVFVISFIGFMFINFDNLKSLAYSANYSKRSILKRSSVDFSMAQWIEENSSKNAVFIVPLRMNNFYIESERAIFVSWKHSPQSSEDILEWYQRLKLMNKGIDFFDARIPYVTIHSNYKNLTEEEIINIQKAYPEITHIIMPKESSLSFPVLFETKLHVLYEL